jgi:bifunctional DNase/RNase
VGKRAVQTEVDHQPSDALVALPLDTPAWITSELVELTQKVWQPYYTDELSVEDAITILRNASDLLGTLARR